MGARGSIMKKEINKLMAFLESIKDTDPSVINAVKTAAKTIFEAEYEDEEDFEDEEDNHEYSSDGELKELVPAETWEGSRAIEVKGRDACLKALRNAGVARDEAEELITQDEKIDMIKFALKHKNCFFKYLENKENGGIPLAASTLGDENYLGKNRGWKHEGDDYMG